MGPSTTMPVKATGPYSLLHQPDSDKNFLYMFIYKGTFKLTINSKIALSTVPDYIFTYKSLGPYDEWRELVALSTEKKRDARTVDRSVITTPLWSESTHHLEYLRLPS